MTCTSPRTTAPRRAGALALSDILTSKLQIFCENQDVFYKQLSRHDAEDAIDGLDGRKYDGRELSVQYARQGYPADNLIFVFD